MKEITKDTIQEIMVDSIKKVAACEGFEELGIMHNDILEKIFDEFGEEVMSEVFPTYNGIILSRTLVLLDKYIKSNKQCCNK